MENPLKRIFHIMYCGSPIKKEAILSQERNVLYCSYQISMRKKSVLVMRIINLRLCTGQPAGMFHILLSGMKQKPVPEV